MSSSDNQLVRRNQTSNPGLEIAKVAIPAVAGIATAAIALKKLSNEREARMELWEREDDVRDADRDDAVIGTLLIGGLYVLKKILD